MKQKISGQFNTENEALLFAIIPSVTDICIKNRQNVIDSFKTIANLQAEYKIVFAMSKGEINFYEFAEYFKDLTCKKTLIFRLFFMNIFTNKNWIQTQINIGIIIVIKNIGSIINTSNTGFYQFVDLMVLA